MVQNDNQAMPKTARLQCTYQDYGYATAIAVETKTFDLPFLSLKIFSRWSQVEDF